MSEQHENLTPVEKMVKEFLYPRGGVNPIFVICSILQIPAFAIAEELKVTRPRMSHYRSGEAPVPEIRIQQALEFLKKKISEIEKEIAREKKKSPDKTTLLLIADLERRVELAKKIAKL
ncbi:MAG: hypothetical protein JNL76_08410 [Alphaproteobacteria bacterium]|nr:hypothetical protein [Alphaproteobacteria bacterium]